MENKNLDISNNLLKKEEQRKKYQEVRKNKIIEMVQRQTDYDYDKIIERLDFWNGNYLNVIKEWLNPSFKKGEKIKKKTTTNQTKWNEIRHFMDDVNKQQINRKRQKEYIEKKKQEYLKYLQSKNTEENVKINQENNNE
jgi:hypothetical protein